MNEPATRLPRWSPREEIGRLRDHLARGGLLAIPTESSYGLAADPRNQKGVEAIYRVKERERGKALLVVGADLQQLAALGVDPEASGAAEIAAFWPAPLTVILPLGPGAELPAAAGGSTLAFRIPAHRELRKMLSRLGFALTATSANLAGAEPIVNPSDLDVLLAGQDAMVWDDGELPGGPPSTLVEKSAAGSWQVLRHGAYRGKALPPK
jgi:L-threonylcarbamoyladenylate synthase